MKKRFTLMLIAALVAVTSFAQPVKKQQMTFNQSPTELQRTPSLKPFQTVAMPQTAKATALKAKKAPKKAFNLADVEWPINAMACGLVYDLDDDGNLVDATAPYFSTQITVNLVDATTVSIVGWFEGADEPVLATVNVEDGTFEIAPGQTMFTDETYGPVVLANVVDTEAPLTGQFNEDGTFSINEVWGGLLTEGDYAGYFYTTLNYTPIIALPNGVMNATDYSNNEVTYPVYILQDPSTYVATVFNFGGYGTGVDIEIKEFAVFQLWDQPYKYAGEDVGVANVSGLTSDYYLETATGVVSGSVMTFNGMVTIYAGTSIYELWNGTTITLTDGSEWAYPVIEDVPAMPADPEFITINPYDANNEYGSVIVDIPNYDVDGNLLKEDKLFYVIYGQKDGEITKITYPADLYQNLDEDLTEIPYSYFDGWDFDKTSDGYKRVFLNFEFDYDAMGVQSIYYGGGEVNATDIIWFVPEESETTEAQWVAAEQGYENAQEVTDIVISEADGITGVFAQAEGINPPKYYNTGESVRIYAGNTLTISSAEYPITMIELVLGNRTDVELSSEEGDFAVDTENKIATWEGEATEVTFTVPQGLTPPGQAYIAGINVYYLGGEAEPELIELPDGAEVEEYYFRAGYEGEEDDAVNAYVNVAFVGDQVYIQGLCQYNSDTWVVGTMTDNVLTIPAGEYVGDYYTYDEESDTEYIFNLMTEEITFTYDPEKDEFTTNSIAIDAYYDGQPVGNFVSYDYAVITKVVEVAATPADPEFTGWNLDVNDTSYPYVDYVIPLVDTNGNPMLGSKLAYRFYYATEEEGEVRYVCTTDAYEEISEDMSEIPYNFSDDWDIYNYRLYVYAEDFTKWTKIGIQSVYYGGGETNESNIVWVDLAEYWEAVGIEEIAAAQSKSVKFYDLQGRQVNADAKGIVIRVDRMADGSTKTTKMLRK